MDWRFWYSRRRNLDGWVCGLKLQKGTLWGPHFCVGVIFRPSYIAMRPDRFPSISTMRRGG